LLATFALATASAHVAGCVGSSSYDSDAGRAGMASQHSGGAAGVATSGGVAGVATSGGAAGVATSGGAAGVGKAGNGGAECGGGYGGYGGDADYWRCHAPPIDAGTGGVGGVTDFDRCFGGYAGDRGGQGAAGFPASAGSGSVPAPKCRAPFEGMCLDQTTMPTLYQGRMVNIAGGCLSAPYPVSCSESAAPGEACWVRLSCTAPASLTLSFFRLPETPCIPDASWRACTPEEKAQAWAITQDCP
jgi:hypothetical protein